MADDFLGAAMNGYEIVSLIGLGGMARVYLARQQSMNRQVALKVLPLQFLSDDTYLQRFHREVKIVSQLEHAHIVPVYDYGEHAGQPYIVMRYMAGGSADDLLQKGSLPLDKVLSIIAEIAPALDYAHSKGVLHRDLKPSNVLLDEAGSAFLSDFGIARLNEPKGATITTEGVVGTPSYMSPEQAQGREMDGRSDLYSLGIMLFELTTGRRPFEADTPYSIAVMQVTTPAPSPREYNAALSPAVERVILRALRKDPAERYARATELAEDLRQSLRAGSPHRPEDAPPRLPLYQPAPVYVPQASPPPQPPAQRYATPMQPGYASAPAYPPMNSTGYTGLLISPQPRRASPWAGALIGGGVGCLFIGVLIVLAILVVRALLPDTALLSVSPQPGVTGAPVVQPARTPTPARMALSPTATPTLDATSEAARATLLARRTRTQTPQAPLPFPTLPGGSPAAITSRTVSVPAALRSLGGSLVFADPRGDGGFFQIIRLDLATGEERQLTSGGYDSTYPVVSPDGRWIAFQSTHTGSAEIYVMNLNGGELRRLTDNPYLDRLPSWSPNSEWVLYSSDVRGDGSFDLVRTRIDGAVTEVVLSNNERKSHARYSPDGRRIVFTTGTDVVDARSWEIAVLDTQTDQVTRLTDNNVRDASPTFSPDGSAILFVTARAGGSNSLALMDADGGNVRLLLDDGANNWAAGFSPDGRHVVFTRASGAQDRLYVLPLDSDRPTPLASSGHSASWHR